MLSINKIFEKSTCAAIKNATLTGRKRPIVNVLIPKRFKVIEIFGDRF